MSDIQEGKYTFLGRFRNRVMENAYLDYCWSSERRRTAFVGLITGPIYLCALSIDYMQLGSGPALGMMTAVRLTVALIGISLVFCTLTAESNRRMTEILLTLYLLSIMLGESMEVVAKGGMAISAGLSPTVVIALFYFLFLPPSPWPPLIGAVGGGGIYLYFMATAGNASPDNLITTGLFLLLVCLFGLYHLSRFGQSRRREYLALHEIRVLSEIDELTGIRNRRSILRLTQKQLQEASQQKTPFSILMIDLDRFKLINDVYGHLAGDEVLRSSVRRCVEQLGENEYMGRLGGEEFLVLLPGKTLEHARETGNSMVEALSKTPIHHLTHRITTTASIGAAQAQPDSRTVDDLIALADRALYLAKRNGRNMVCAEHQCV